MTVLVLSIGLALCVSFLCSLLESSVLSLRPADVAELRHRNANVGALWERLRQNIDQPIAAILILNTIANTLGASIAGAEFARLAVDADFSNTTRLWMAKAAFSLGFAFIIIQWGEILPKTLGVRYRTFVASHVGPALTAAVGILKPAMWLTRTLNRPFERGTEEGIGAVDEIRALVRYASFARLIDRRQERIMTKTVQLDTMSIERIMTPRTAVAALEVSQTVTALIALVRRTGYSRIPIFREQLDDIVGVVLAKDILMALHDGKLTSEQMSTRTVEEFMTEPLFMPESSTVGHMLAQALERKAHMVIALDEHGGFAGLVTLEDAIEELFGEISDEHDRVERLSIEHVARNRWLAAGRCPIEKVSRAVGVELGSADDDYTTLSGLLMMLSGNVPQAGDVIRKGGLTFEVLEATRMMPRKVEITKN